MAWLYGWRGIWTHAASGLSSVILCGRRTPLSPLPVEEGRLRGEVTPQRTLSPGSRAGVYPPSPKGAWGSARTGGASSGTVPETGEVLGNCWMDGWTNNEWTNEWAGLQDAQQVLLNGVHR
ncbi:hypothetical protein HJG60_011029 [Phyllostomus discolor]|uniref:Uncharacterized protein n=1 Tax=Phyllostomus discolor TaxID=89673 RepID=A0A834AE12_9CHIR|nr:hypothetical protein HJG60_011029 [Phyllostomus discolor]